jgi:hypothetical protein
MPRGLALIPDPSTLPPEFAPWVESSFERALSALTWREIARALGALTQDYVQRRHRLGHAATLAGRGKQAAFALYYAPRHYVVVHHVLMELGAPARAVPQIVDVGCGTGVAGAAWSALFGVRPPVIGLDPSAWALAAARPAYRALGIPGRTVHSTVERWRPPRAPFATVAAWTVNELDDTVREKLLALLTARAAQGGGLLVVEPLATRIAPWWEGWAEKLAAVGGRADAWRCAVTLPERVVQLGRSAGLDPLDLGARSLWVAPRAGAAGTAHERVASAS